MFRSGLSAMRLLNRDVLFAGGSVAVVRCLNVVLMVFIVVLSLLLGQGVRQQPVVMQPVTIADSVEPVIVRKQAWERYMAVLSRTPLFAAQVAPALPAVPLTPAVNIAAQVAELQLQGVISGAQGLQAIIYKRGADQTIYCRGGERIGDLTVGVIDTQRVTVHYGEQTFDLFL